MCAFLEYTVPVIPGMVIKNMLHCSLTSNGIEMNNESAEFQFLSDGKLYIGFNTGNRLEVQPLIPVVFVSNHRNGVTAQYRTKEGSRVLYNTRLKVWYTDATLRSTQVEELKNKTPEKYYCIVDNF